MIWNNKQENMLVRNVNGMKRGGNFSNENPAS